MGVTAYKAPQTCANVDRDDRAAWANPDNAKASDDARAISDVAALKYSDWLRCTNFGFTTDDIPDGSTVIGIELKVERHGESANIQDNAIYLRDSGGQIGDNKASATVWPTSDGEATYGGAADTWNAGLSDSDVRASTFGIDFSAWNKQAVGSVEARIDCISIRIYYAFERTANVAIGVATVADRHAVYGHVADIDIGPGAVIRAGHTNFGGNTTIDLGNPANDTGIITSVEIYVAANASNVKIGTFYGTGTTYTNRDSHTIGAVTGGSKQTFSGLSIYVETGDFLGIYGGPDPIDLDTRRDTTGFDGIVTKAGDQFGQGEQADYAPYAGDAISIYGSTTELVGGRKAAVHIGILVSATRIRAIHKISEVAIGILIAAEQHFGTEIVATVALGIVVSASRVKHAPRTAAIQIGIATTGLRNTVVSRASDVLVGISTVGARTTVIARTCATAVGVAVSASRVLAITRTASVAIGTVVTASRLPNYRKFANVAIGIAVVASRATVVARSSAVALGISVTATRGFVVGRAATTQLGILVTAVRQRGVVRIADVALGIATTASRATVISRQAQVALGIAVTATRTGVWSRTADIALGISATAIRIFGRVRIASVQVGLSVIATALYSLSRRLRIDVITTQYHKLSVSTAQNRHLSIMTTQYRKVKIITAQNRLLKIITAQYRKIKSLTWGG